MPKITLLGAGSGFTQPLFTDILNIEGLDEGVIGLVDPDKSRLDINIKLLNRLLEIMGKDGWSIEASTDREEILPGSDYVISTIEVAGVECVESSQKIPEKYGIDQCIGDTIGPGGIMKALRTVPVFIDILKDAERLCPQAVTMNYTNPMSILSLAAVESVGLSYVGLCHSVQGSSRGLARMADVPNEELKWKCGGLNHLAWFTEAKWKGEDVYPRILANFADQEIVESDPTRFDMIRQLGYYVTESSGHFSEYVPWYRKDEDIRERYLRDRYLGESGFYARDWPQWRKDTDQKRRDMAEGKMDIPTKRGHEYASDIIEAHHFDRKKTIHASVKNTGLIPNLPQNNVVEVEILVDKTGYTPTYFGDLPEQCAALCRSHAAVYRLTVDGILNEDREAIMRAMMLDPLSAAVSCPADIRKMTEELFEAQKDYIPEFCMKKPAPIQKRQMSSEKEQKDGAEEVSSMAARNVKE
ncbi:MAG: alpha-glucosidase/alpha-galactosidase [Candidatus Sumerlaeota bacterium]